MFEELPRSLSVKVEIAPRDEIREEMSSGEAGLRVTLLGDSLVVEAGGVSGKERRCRPFLGVLAQVRGGIAGAGAR